MLACAEGSARQRVSELAEQGLDPAKGEGIKVRGDSMDGTPADGDWVLVDRSNRDPK